MMNDLPPKSVKAQLIRLDDSLKQIERAKVAGIQRAPGSLPVLEAFQGFLENERKIARRRMLMLTVFAVIVLLGAGLVGGIWTHLQIQRAEVEYLRVTRRTDALAAAMEDAQAREMAELTALEEKFGDESRRIVGQHAALLEGQAGLTRQVDARASEMKAIREQMNQLALENNSLKARVEALSYVGGTIPAGGESPPSVKVPPTSLLPSVAAPASDPVQVVEHADVLLLTIMPEGRTDGIRWQLPRQLIQE